MNNSLNNNLQETVEQYDVVFMLVDHFKELCNDMRVVPGTHPHLFGTPIKIYNNINKEELLNTTALNFIRQHNREPKLYVVTE